MSKQQEQLVNNLTHSMTYLNEFSKKIIFYYGYDPVDEVKDFWHDLEEEIGKTKTNTYKTFLKKIGDLSLIVKIIIDTVKKIDFNTISTEASYPLIGAIDNLEDGLQSKNDYLNDGDYSCNDWNTKGGELEFALNTIETYYNSAKFDMDKVLETTKPLMK